MICPECKQGFTVQDEFSPIVPTILRHRGHKKVLATEVLLSCSNCLYTRTEPIKGIDIDAEWVKFKRTVNRFISLEEIV